MQAVIPAAGRGRRLKELTEHKPKCLLKLAGKPIIIHQVELLIKNGIKKIVVIVGYRAGLVKKALKGIKNVEFIYNPDYEKTNVLVSMWLAKDALSEDYIFLNGDTLFEENVLKGTIKKKGDIVLAVDFKKCAKEDMKVKVKDKRVLKISKKLPLEDSDGEFIGLAKITKPAVNELHNAIDSLMAEERFNSFFEEALQRVIDKRKGYNMRFADISGFFWEEVDFKKDYIRAKSFYEKFT